MARMKLVVVRCRLCCAATEEIDRDGVPPFCKTCGLKDVDTSALGTVAPGNVATLERTQRIEGLARLFGIDALRRAREGGWWDEAADRGDDPDDLLIDAYWSEIEARLTRELGPLTEVEDDLATDAAADGWELGKMGHV